MGILKKIRNFLTRSRLDKEDVSKEINTPSTQKKPEKKNHFPGLNCPHPKTEGPMKIVVKGEEFTIGSLACRECTEVYMNYYSTLCATCDKPILPGMAVGYAGEDSFSHMTYGCVAAGAFYTGIWGEGKLITLHDLNPEKYPKGTTTVASRAFKTGKPVYEEIG